MSRYLRVTVSTKSDSFSFFISYDRSELFIPRRTYINITDIFLVHLSEERQ